jgi:FkbM family methyltransferase
MEKVRVLDTDVYYYDNGCNVEEWLKQGRLYGEANARILESLILSDGVILDCGAHIGTFGLPLAVRGHKIVCIEAADLNVQCLRHTFVDFENVVVEQAILADSARPCGFSRESGPFGWITPGDELTASTIDSIARDHGPVCAIKLDIEGGEIDALRGASETLRQKPPILMECNGFCLMQHGKRCEDLIREVSKHGYLVFIRFSASGTIRVNPDSLFPYGNADVICIHEDNIHRYEWCNSARELEVFELNYILEETKKRSNEELLSYFHFIGA